ncbi:MAG: hypothetical protein P8Y72_15640 [Anaerolineales bacterium]
MNQLKVFLEIGQKKTFAGAVDWPGWCRSGKDEINAMQSLLDYAPRYAQVLAGSGLDFNPPDDIADLVVVERQPGNATTDFGAPDAILSSDQAEVNQTENGFFQEVLQGCWRTFDQAVFAARGKELRTGPRGGGRDLDKILHHLIEGDRGAFLCAPGSLAYPRPCLGNSRSDAVIGVNQVGYLSRLNRNLTA